MQNQKKKIKRTAVLLSILSRYGFEELLVRTNFRQHFTADPASDSGLDSQVPSLSVYERIRIVLEELGPTYIKFGQAFSDREDLLPAELIIELKKLQDKVKPEELDVQQWVADELNIKPEDYFSHIDPVPIASASISQVYTAVLTTGEKVIIKVKRPGIREVVEADLLIMRDFARLLVNYNETFRKINLVQVLEAFEKAIINELSFLREESNMEQFARNFKGHAKLYPVLPYPDLSNDNMLCMEYIAGLKITDREALVKEGFDPKEIAATGLDLYMTQVMEHGFFHADPHAGNLFVLPSAQIAFIDFGSMGSMMPSDKELLENFIAHFMAKDAKRLIPTIKKMAVRFNIIDEKKLERDIHGVFELLSGNSLADIDVKVILKSFSTVLNDNEILMPEHIYLLVRGIVLIEGIGRKLDPEMNIVESMRPYVAKIIKRRLSPEYLIDKGIETLRIFGEGLTEIPENIKNIVTKLDNGELKIVQEIRDFPAFKNAVVNGFSKLSYALIITGFAIASSLIIQADKGPKIWDIPVLGFIGILISGIMGLVFLISFWKKDS